MSRARLEQHRRLWATKPLLARVYAPWFEALLAEAADGGRVVEVGAGPGTLQAFARERRPDLGWLATDLEPCPWNDVAADAGRLPVRGGIADAVLGLDVLHHLPDPAAFFAEASRVLRPGGRLALVEPWISPLSWPIYRFLHEEDCRLGVDAWRPFPGPEKASFDGDAAVPWRIVRDAGAADWRRFGLGSPRVGTTERVRLPAEPRLPAGFTAAPAPRRAGAVPRPLDRPARPPHRPAGRPRVGQVAWPAFRTMLKPRLDSWTAARIVAPLVSFVPFAYGLARGGSFYFRDLSSYFFPIRRFVAEGLRAGEIRYWNPYVNEGIPVVLPPVAYPIDLLQALVPNEWGFSLLLALHVPLAALTFLGLARRLECGPAAATLGALVYALGGFSLSCVNLYIHMEAFAWAPLAISMLIRARCGGARDVILAGVAIAVCLSTTGVEITAQAVACGFVLSASRRIFDHLRFAASVLLGVGLAASPLVTLMSLVSGSRREAGFSITESLSHSVHPVSLLQALIAGFFGDPIASGYSYWGVRFWGGPSPYFVSLYVGGAVLCFVAIGAVRAERHRNRLLLLLAAGLVVCLGRWARLDVLLELAPVLGKFRFPVKAFFTVVVASSLLASAAAERLLTSRRAWWPLLVGSTLVGLGLLSLSLVETWLPGGFAWLQGQFFVAAYPQALRAAALRSVAADAAAGATALLAMAGLAALSLRRRISPRAAVVAAIAIIAADLLRAGAGSTPRPIRPVCLLARDDPRGGALAGRGRPGLHVHDTRHADVSGRGQPHGPERVWSAGCGGKASRPTRTWMSGYRRPARTPPPSSPPGVRSPKETRCAGMPARSSGFGQAACVHPSVQPFTNEALRLRGRGVTRANDPVLDLRLRARAQLA